jgi:hypothetical protein
MVSLASWISVNHKQMKAMLEACLEEMETYLEEIETAVKTSLEEVNALDWRQIQKQWSPQGNDRKPIIKR